jgi:hypothetical protein
MARALDRFQSITLRANFLQRCYLPSFVGSAGCEDGMMQLHLRKLRFNTDMAREYHQSLYLGAHGLQPFTDSRLLVRNWVLVYLATCILTQCFVVITLHQCATVPLASRKRGAGISNAPSCRVCH